MYVSQSPSRSMPYRKAKDGHPVTFPFQRSNTHKTVLCKHRAWNACLHLWHGKVSQYVFVCAYSVKTDHKSLEQIKLKDLSDAWICLQRKLLHLQNYDVTIKYHPGKEMLVADVLSHYSPLDAPEILLDITINQVQITPQKNAEFQAAICDDPILCSLADTIFTGWPQDINDVPHSVCPYHAHHNILTVKDDHILHVEALVILPTDRVKVLQAVHKGHLSITKCQYHAWQYVYWPGIHLDIKHTVLTCATCQHQHLWEPWQPLQLTLIPECPSQHFVTDFFHFEGSEYLTFTDYYYSKMPVIFRIPTSQCNAAKTKSIMKELFAEYSISESPMHWQWPTV